MTNDYANAYQTKKLYSLYSYTLSLSHTWDDAQMRTTHNISHIPSMTNDSRKCAPNKSSTLSISLTLTHICDIHKCVPHTKHHTYSVSRLCSLSCAYTHKEYFHVYMLIRICVREGLQGWTRDFRLREKIWACQRFCTWFEWSIVTTVFMSIRFCCG